MQDKSSLRKELIRKRLMIPDDERKDLDSAVFDKIVSMDEYIKADIILVYVSYNGETDTYRLIKDALNRSKRVACPVCSKLNGEPFLEFCFIDSIDELMEGYRGIPEPDKNKAQKVIEKDIGQALVIVPMVGYDREGNRLGYGKGYYDRFLSSYDHRNAIGIAYSIQECEKLPAESHDIKPDTIITDDRTLRITNRSGNERSAV